MLSLDFNGRTVAVSGAGIGIGRMIAAYFAKAGARVFGSDILTDNPAPATRLDRVDLTDRAEAADWIARIERETKGPIEVLVCNAGGVAGQWPKPIEAVEDVEWDRIIAINLASAMALSRAVVPGMKIAGKGAIVTVTSGAALQPSLTGIQAYASAKHGLLGLTRQLGHELGPWGIRVNSVAPGFVRTNVATERQWASYGEEGQKKFIERIALRRLGQAEDIAGAVLFLASDLASYINGQVLSVDGGK